MIRFLSGRIRTWVWPSWYPALMVAFYLAYELMFVYLRWRWNFSEDDLREFRSQRDGLALFLVAVAGALRAGSFHPLLWTLYGRWLARTPWRVSKPLPLRTVHLTLGDIVFLGVVALLLLHGNYFTLLRVPLLFLAGYLAVVGASLLTTDTEAYGYAIVFGLGLVVRLWMNPWAALAVAALLYPIAYFGLLDSLARFPWSKPELLSTREAPLKATAPTPGRGKATNAAGSMALGWPFDLLRPNQPDTGIGRWDGAAISLLLGWWVYAILANPLEPELRRMIVGLGSLLFPMSLAFVRILRYCLNFSSPINLLGRVFTSRWIIPGYDKVFVAPILAIAVSAIGEWLIAGMGCDQLVVVPIVVASAAMLILNLGPSFQDWRHTGNHRISPRYNSRTHFRL